MAFKIIIILSFIFQIIAVSISLSLVKRTKYNLTWIFLCLGFASLLLKMILESLPFFFDIDRFYYRILYLWIGFASSLFFAIGLFLITKIFAYINKIEKEKRANEKKYLSVMLQAEENERRRLAKNLHDDLGPLLSTIKMSISALKNEYQSPQAISIVKNIDNVVVEALKNIKEISNNLNPHVLDNFGLDKAIDNFINKINATSSIIINYTSNLNNLRLEQNIETSLYRIVCELVNNTIMHAEAKNIIINIDYDLYSVSLFYTDDGKGFELDRQHNSIKEKHLVVGSGLDNIKSRVKALQGDINIKTQIGEGVEFKIIIPFSS